MSRGRGTRDKIVPIPPCTLRLCGEFDLVAAMPRCAQEGKSAFLTRDGLNSYHKYKERKSRKPSRPSAQEPQNPSFSAMPSAEILCSRGSCYNFDEIA